MVGLLTDLSDGYNLTEDSWALPLVFRNAICDKFFVEFLKLSEDGNGKNHAILKVDFQRNVHGSYKGARIMMGVDFEPTLFESDGSRSAYQPGTLLVKPVKYQQASNKAVRTCQVSMAPSLSLGHIIGALLQSELQYFYFIAINGQYFGCRDFVYVLLYLYLGSPACESEADDDFLAHKLYTYWNKPSASLPIL
ncbi:hypothetical protein QQZ08_001498 [Neonectria magnoliae]|uniref:DUF7770 domain-containing protein n=1 Tax=Neonectria magnoliae TaxID=2732573 RepID=A0ABR1IF20_9HYPO